MISVQKRQSQYDNVSTKLVTRIGAQRAPARAIRASVTLPTFAELIDIAVVILPLSLEICL